MSIQWSVHNLHNFASEPFYRRLGSVNLGFIWLVHVSMGILLLREWRKITGQTRELSSRVRVPAKNGNL